MWPKTQHPESWVCGAQAHALSTLYKTSQASAAGMGVGGGEDTEGRWSKWMAGNRDKVEKHPRQSGLSCLK